MLNRLFAIVFATVILASCTACGKSWTCDECGKTWSGKAYCGMTTDETMCEECAAKYWMPLPYENYQKK